MVDLPSQQPPGQDENDGLSDDECDLSQYEEGPPHPHHGNLFDRLSTTFSGHDHIPQQEPYPYDAREQCYWPPDPQNPSDCSTAKTRETLKWTGEWDEGDEDWRELNAASERARRALTVSPDTTELQSAHRPDVRNQIAALPQAVLTEPEGNTADIRDWVCDRNIVGHRNQGGSPAIPAESVHQAQPSEPIHAPVAAQRPNLEAGLDPVCHAPVANDGSSSSPVESVQQQRPGRRQMGGPHACQCGKSYKHAGGLKKHVRTVNGERKHACSVCDKKFTQPGDRDRHFNSVCSTNPTMHACDECGKQFDRPDNVRRHLEDVHDILLPGGSRADDDTSTVISSSATRTSQTSSALTESSFASTPLGTPLSSQIGSACCFSGRCVTRKD